MPGRRTGWTVEHGISKYSQKIESQQEAYKYALNDTVVQIQNLKNLLDLRDHILKPWLNAKGISGTMRIVYQDAFYEIVKILDEGYSGQALMQRIASTIAKYLKRGVRPEYIDELVTILMNAKGVTQDYISIQKISK